MQPGPDRSDDRTIPAEAAGQARAEPGVRVGHEQHRLAGLQAGDVIHRLQRAGVDPGQDIGHACLGEHDGHQAGWRRPSRPLGGSHQRVGGSSGQQPMAEALEVALADTVSHRQLLGVACDAGCGQGVDVGEHQLGEAHHLVGR